ncbi:MAG: crossover junction endodeoxyribonuclease RuvC [Deltaproteobacteria bacterium]|nr:crossover junction endodeoxyribonuclease RuvC [Deltaproteobacteria bacterium]MCX7952356.1 crossover junction endodeoxyribonuclease RuvC [Deltaproteobacteria bacterium]
MQKVLAVDPSSSSLGWAIIDTREIPLDAGVFYYNTDISISNRVKHIVNEIKHIIDCYNLKRGDYFVVESSAGCINPRTFLILERIRGAGEAVALLNGLTVLGRINPRSIHVNLLGIKKSLARVFVKSAIRSYVEKQFSAFLKSAEIEVIPKNQDVFDALLLGYYFVRILKMCNNGGDVSAYLTDI